MVNLQNLRHIVEPGSTQPSYLELIKRAGPKLATLGLPALVARNGILGLGFAPRVIGNEDRVVDAIAISGAIAVSHPIELARVLIVNAGVNKG